MVKNHSSNSSSYSSLHTVPISGIQGPLLQVTVVGCNKLKDTEWISRQDPYVCLEYAHTKYRTRTCTDGGKNPTFQEKFMFTLIEGLLEFSVAVWNSNTITSDQFIGNGRIHLQKVLSQGYDDSAWSIQDKRGRHAGEVRLIMHYANATRPAASSHAPSAPPFVGAPAPQVLPYSAPPLTSSYPPATYPPTTVVPPYSAPPSTSLYPPSSHNPLYPPTPSVYPPSPYHDQSAVYLPSYPPPPSYPPQSLYPPHSYTPGASYPPPY